jgi:hypothetical protein
MRDQVLDGRLPRRRARPRDVVIEAGQHRQAGELGAVVGHRSVQVNTALLHLLQRGHRAYHLVIDMSRNTVSTPAGAGGRVIMSGSMDGPRGGSTWRPR